MFDKTFDVLRDWCEAHDIRVRMQRFQVGKAGEFDGLSIVMNPAFESEELVYYLAHGIGSIVRRSLTPDAIQRLFNELRDAKQQKETEPLRVWRKQSLGTGILKLNRPSSRSGCSRSADIPM